jgi:uncharacterized protein (DUF2267 family)
MSATGLEVFDRTIQSTNIWLKEIGSDIGPDRDLAWHVLGVVLRALRDRLPVDLAAHFGAQLPLLIRGTYYDRFRPESQPQLVRSRGQLLERIRMELGDVRPINPEAAVKAVFKVCSCHLPAGQVSKARDALPHEIRALWAPPESLRETAERKLTESVDSATD